MIVEKLSKPQYLNRTVTNSIWAFKVTNLPVSCPSRDKDFAEYLRGVIQHSIGTCLFFLSPSLEEPEPEKIFTSLLQAQLNPSLNPL